MTSSLWDEVIFMKSKTKKIALLGISAALAMVMSFVESLIPPLAAIPGIKIGLANLVTVFILYKLGMKYAVSINLVRILLSSILFGNLQVFVFSLAGACLSLLGMFIMKKTGLFSVISVSILGGILHNIGQITVACFWTSTPEVVFYLPVLLISGTVAGTVIGLLAGFVTKKLEKMKF